MRRSTVLSLPFQLVFPANKQSHPCWFLSRFSPSVSSLLIETNWLSLTRHYKAIFQLSLSCHGCLIKTGVEKNKQHLNIDWNFDHQMSLSKSRCWYSNNCLHFLKQAVPCSCPNKIPSLERQHNNTQHNGTQHTGLIRDTEHNCQSVYNNAIMLSIIVLILAFYPLQME
jgi:hypothetical protein